MCAPTGSRDWAPPFQVSPPWLGRAFSCVGILECACWADGRSSRSFPGVLLAGVAAFLSHDVARTDR